MLLFALYFALPTSAQETIPIGEIITITVTADTPARLQFDAEIGLYYRITTQALTDEFDSVVALIAPDEVQVAYADDYILEDGTLSRDAQIERFAAIYDAPYTIRVDSFNGVTEGDVEVLVEVIDPFDLETDVDDAIITLTVTAEEHAVISLPQTFDAGIVQTITVRDASGNLDPILRLKNVDGELLAHNDDHTTADTTLSPFDARVSNFTVPEDGEYIIEVVDFIGNAGKFVIQIGQEIQTSP